MTPDYCEHRRLAGNCETCAEQHARKSGFPLSPPVPSFEDTRPVADRDLRIPAKSSDLDRSTVIAAGTRVPPEHVEAYEASKPKAKTARR